MGGPQRGSTVEEGKFARIYVSVSEYCDLDVFVKNYLEGRGYRISDNNLRIVRKVAETFPGYPPIQSHDLVAYLNKCFNRI